MKGAPMKDDYGIQKDSASWVFFVKISFVIAALSMIAGIWFLPTEPWIKGYMAIGLFFVIGSSITLTKTMRDEHEANKLIKKIDNAKTEKILKEYSE
jgi:hypothetical protein